LWSNKGCDQCWQIIVFWPIINMHINWICMKSYLEFVLFSLSGYIYNQQMFSFMISITYWYMFMALTLCIRIYCLRHMILFIKKGFNGQKKKGCNLLSLFYHCQAFFSTYLVSELFLNYFVKVIINEKDFLYWLLK